ncbi:MAG TPA: DUF3558 domain-containing protein [Actinophytocola sp.]|nr:DUF3558 domain-containing protein [Actinophytocola sp.]
MIARVVAGVAGLLLVAGCGVARSGVNPTEPPRVSPSSPTASTTSADLLPPRPRDLDLTGVDPCTDVLTDAQLRELVYDIGYESAPVPTESDIVRGPICKFGSSTPIHETGRDLSTLIIISLSEGAQAWLTDPRRASSAELSRQTSVEGFPALVLPHPRFGDHCTVVVDTADGQYLAASSTPDAGNDTSYDRYCTEAERVAAMGIRTLSASR